MGGAGEIPQAKGALGGLLAKVGVPGLMAFL